LVLVRDMLDDKSFVTNHDQLIAMLTYAVHCNSFGVIKHIVSSNLYLETYNDLFKYAVEFGHHHIAECLCRAIGNKVFDSSGVSMKDYYALRGSAKITTKWNNAVNKLITLPLCHFKKHLT